MKEKLKSVYVRVTEKEKTLITSKAKKCGLPISEYIRKRALGYSPKALLPETFYIFSEKLGALYEQLKIQGADKLREDVLKLLDEIQRELLFPEKRKHFLRRMGAIRGPRKAICFVGERSNHAKMSLSAF